LTLKNKIWAIASTLVVVLLIMKPELIPVGLIIDSIGLDIFLLLVQAKIGTDFGFIYSSKIKPLFLTTYTFYQKLDPYFVIPTKQVVLQYPPILLHAIPGLLSLYWVMFLAQW